MARSTRSGADGRLVLLKDQDRSRWDQGEIAEGTALVVAALRGALRAGRPGRFALQAAIAAVHAEAPSYAATDWPELLALYDLLLRAWPSPVVALNRAVVVSMIDGPAAGLAEIARLEEQDGPDARLAGYHYLPAAKADLLRQLGRAGRRSRPTGGPGAGRQRGRAGLPGRADRHSGGHAGGRPDPAGAVMPALNEVPLPWRQRPHMGHMFSRDCARPSRDRRGVRRCCRCPDVAVSYGPVRALDGVSLTVGEGEIVALAGENGAGKTTLVRCIGGDIEPTTG